jgi:hypothetical protein
MSKAANAFELVCDARERSGQLDRLEARGTVRLALTAAGLEAASVKPEQMAIVPQRVMPEEPQKRGVADAVAFCEGLVAELKNTSWDAASSDSPDAVFARLGGSA